MYNGHQNGNINSDSGRDDTVSLSLLSTFIFFHLSLSLSETSLPPFSSFFLTFDAIAHKFSLFPAWQEAPVFPRTTTPPPPPFLFLNPNSRHFRPPQKSFFFLHSHLFPIKFCHFYLIFRIIFVFKAVGGVKIRRPGDRSRRSVGNRRR